MSFMANGTTPSYQTAREIQNIIPLQRLKRGQGRRGAAAAALLPLSRQPLGEASRKLLGAAWGNLTAVTTRFAEFLPHNYQGRPPALQGRLDKFDSSSDGMGLPVANDGGVRMLSR